MLTDESNKLLLSGSKLFSLQTLWKIFNLHISLLNLQQVNPKYTHLEINLFEIDLHLCFEVAQKLSISKNIQINIH